MNAALPATLPQSSAAPAARRSGTPSEGEAEDFGRMLKAGDDAEGGMPAATRDENGTALDEPASDLEPSTDVPLATDGKDAAAVTAKPKKASKRGEGEEQDKSEAAEALMPFLTVAEPNEPASARRGDAEITQGAKADKAASAAAKAVARPAEETTDGGKPQPAVLEKSGVATSGRPEATFGRSLIANLNDLATQAPDRLNTKAETSDADGQATDSRQDAPSARRERGTLIADAVSRAREPRQAGDRRADLQPAAYQKAQPVPLTQGPLATGTPIVEALVAPAPAAALYRAAAANANAGQTAPGVQTLKIQLQPVELGAVTANLRMTGEQLSVEIEVESVEAYNRLSGETDAIARALRSHGITVDEVVIQAPQIHAAASVRDGAGAVADTSANGGRSFSTGAESGQPGGSGHPNRDAGQDNHYDIDKPSSVDQSTIGNSTGNGVYI